LKKLSVIIISLWLLLVGVFVTQSAAEWMFVGSSQQIANTASNMDSTAPSFGDIALGSMGHLNIGSPSFFPMQVDQVVVSLKGVPNVDTELTSDTFSQFLISTGIQTEKSNSSMFTYSTDLFPKDEAPEAESTVLFVGIGVDFGSAFIKGNAFVGQPEGLNGGYGKREMRAPDTKGFNAEAYGFEASAGYQVSEKFALEAGLSRMKNKNDDTKADEVWAVYAQAILNLAPGMQIIPEVGQIELQNDNQDAEKADFYAGAKWEINF
jgi:hypothetical protein